MSDAARAWLAGRMPAPPAPLRERLEDALARADDAAGVPAVLAEAALARLHDALALGDDRAAAFELLAADALLTYAFEAAAELGVDTVEALAEAYGPARLATLIAAEP